MISGMVLRPTSKAWVVIHELEERAGSRFSQAMICLYQVIHQMRARKSGTIISISSRAGTVTAPFAGAYSAGKSALIRATSCWQAELELDGLGEDITLYALHPGGVKTDAISESAASQSLHNLSTDMSHL